MINLINSNRKAGAILPIVYLMVFLLWPSLGWSIEYSIEYGGETIILNEEEGRDIPQDYLEGDRPSRGNIRRYGSLGIWATVTKKIKSELFVEHIHEQSPAKGLLLDKDVILGVLSHKESIQENVTNIAENGRFIYNAHKKLPEVIEQVERLDTDDKLVLMVWRPETIEVTEKRKPFWGGHKKYRETFRRVVNHRNAEVIAVEIPMPQVGAFSALAPYGNDAKSDMLVDLIVNAYDEWDFKQKGKINNKIENICYALGLLATGDERHMPFLNEFVRSFTKSGTNFLESHGDKKSKFIWKAAYTLVFLAEYYGVTGDKRTFDVLKSKAIRVAQGVSGVGTWGHGDNNAQKDGLCSQLGGYGTMNQSSAIACLGLVLAQKVGVKDPYVERAIKLSLDYFEYNYTDRGALPYGDSAPRFDTHDSNGRTSMVATLMDLAGRKDAADYFTRMALASHKSREGGHTGHYFSWQWGAVGAARGGQEAAAAFLKSVRYFTRSSIDVDGKSWDQPIIAPQGDKYKWWNTAGARLLELCLDRKVLYITGKGGSVVTPVVGEELEAILAASEGWDWFWQASDEQLLDRLGDFSPRIRYRAANILGRRAKNHGRNYVDQLIEMLQSENRYRRYGACIALANTGNVANWKALRAIYQVLLTDKDTKMRYWALGALQNRFSDRRNARLKRPYPTKEWGVLLANIIIEDDPNDPYRKNSGYAGELCFDQIFKDWEDAKLIPEELRTKAIKAILENPNGEMRQFVTRRMRDSWPKEELTPFWSTLYFGMKFPPPSDGKYANGFMWNGFDIMGKSQIEEGIPISMFNFLVEYKHIGQHEFYGKNLVPWIEADPVAKRRAENDAKNWNRIKSTDVPPLVSVAHQIRNHEPLLSPNFSEILRYIKPKLPGGILRAPDYRDLKVGEEGTIKFVNQRAVVNEEENKLIIQSQHSIGDQLLMTPGAVMVERLEGSAGAMTAEVQLVRLPIDSGESFVVSSQTVHWDDGEQGTKEVFPVIPRSLIDHTQQLVLVVDTGPEKLHYGHYQVLPLYIDYNKITPGPDNQAPVALDSILEMDENTSLQISLGALDPDEDPLTFQINEVSVGQVFGTLPNIQYQPPLDYTGNAQILFSVSDGDLVDEGIVQITIHRVNTAPVALNSNIDAVQGQSLAISLQAYDAEGDHLTYELIQGPTQGSLTGEGSSLVYTPYTTSLGADRFSWLVTDGALSSSIALAEINIEMNDQVAESGNIMLSATESGEWTTLKFQKAYRHPVVIAQVMTDHDPHPITVRVKDVTSTQANIRLEEFEYQDGLHQPEDVSYMVVQQGAHTLVDGTLLQAGSITMNSSKKTYPFHLDYTSDQLGMMLQVASVNQDDAVFTRIRGVSESGFTAHLQGPEIDQTHAAEEVHWVVFPTGYGNNGDLLYEVTKQFKMSHNWKMRRLHQTFATSPIAFSQISKRKRQDSDPANVRLRGVSLGHLEIKIQEEKSKDREVKHGLEEVTVFAFDRGLFESQVSHNTVPRAFTQHIVCPKNTVVQIVLQGSDNEGDVLSYSIDSQPLNGTLSGSDAILEYEPLVGYIGEDEFTFYVSDGVFNSKKVKVSLQVKDEF